MFVLDRSQRARIQKFPRIVAAVVSLALLTTGMEAPQLAAAVPAADPKPTAQRVDSRPDVVSAAVSARAQGSRVEVESMRTETSTTWSNPDGTMTTDAHATPIRFKDAAGAWQTIDLTLQKAPDGTVAPRSHQRGLRLGKRNAATGQVFASADSGAGRQVEWLSPWKLPEPTLDGAKATYAEVQPGVDLVLDAQRNGFENDFVVKQRPAAAPVWRIPLRTKGLTPKPQADGSIQFVDAKNVVHSTIPVGYMWDAAVNPATGDPTHKTVAKVTVEQVSAGKATLVIAPDAAWFTDPARVFPVTVDPTYVTGTLKANFDTWVQSDVTTDQSASNELRVGYNGSQTARSYLNFATSTFAGKDILSANLSLWQTTSLSCTASAMVARSSTPATTATRWSNKPALGASYGTVSAAKGFSSSCPGGRISVPMTGLAQAWSTAPYPTGGLSLTAGNEADANSWKKFYSTVAIADPYVTMTWNRAPAAPAAPTFVSAVAYAPPGGASALYSPYVNPWISTKGTDADGNTVKYVTEFHDSTTVTASTLKATCTTGTFASGSTAGCQTNANLPDNTTIYARAKTFDGRLYSGWSAWSTIRIGAAPTAAPTVSCPSPYVINSWQDNNPTADINCTITATGTGFNAPGYVRVSVDGKSIATNFTGGAAGQWKITPSSDPAVAKATVTIKKDTPGLHQVIATAETPAGRISSSSSYSFGWGGSALTTPTASPRITTTDTIKIQASGPPKGLAATPTAKVRWRTSGYGGSAYDTVGWNIDDTVLPVTDNGTAGLSVSALWDTNNAKIDQYLDSDPDTAGIQPTTLNDRVPVLLDVQVCFTYNSSSQCTWSQTPDTTIQRVPHAFGNGYPTATAGPGQVALWTGEFNADETDVSVPGYTGSLTISRSHSTYAGPADTINSVFGPGWVAHFDGTDVGGAGYQIVDSTPVDGTVALVDGDGTSLVYETPSGQRRTGTSLPAGTWVPADEDTELEGSQLTVAGAGASTTMSLVEDDGTVTTFAVVAAPTAAPVSFRPTTIAEPGTVAKTTYAYDAGRIARILAPAPPGVTCAAFNPALPPLTGLNPGCRALRFAYTTVAGGARLTEAWLDIYNPSRSGGADMDSIKVAAYTYDSSGRLTVVTDPRSNLSTEYGYNGQNHLTSVKPAGELPIQLAYVTVDQREKLDTVKRERPAGDPTGGTATLAKFVYNVPLSGAGLPDLSSSSVARWNQKAAPTNGFAVFGPDHPLSSAPGSDDWQFADLQYTDASGYTVNSASYGASAWQYNATDYNDQGAVVRQLDERALRLVIDNQLPSGATVDQLATLTVYNPDIKNIAGDTVLTPAGTLVTDTYGPARFAALKDGTIKWIRPHSHTTFDEGAPNAGINPDTNLPYRVATTESSSAFDPGSGQDEILSRSLTDYGPPVSGDAAGWALNQPGKVTTDANPAGLRDDTTGDITQITRYDAEGRVVESRQPGSNGADAGTTKTVYFTAAGNAAFVECGGKPQWAGLVCKTYPAAAPTSASGTTPSLPTTTNANFSYLLAPTSVVETSGSVTRTTATTYLVDGRVDTTQTAVAGLGTSSPTTKKKTTYDAATGKPTVVTAVAPDETTTGTITGGFDTWGRPTTYQPSGEQVTRTSYNAAGQVDAVTDANGSTSYSYDGTDAAGRIERRGLVTKVDVSTAGSTWTSAGAYDADGSIAVQKLPGGITKFNDLDNAGEPIGLRYTGQTTTVNDDGSSTVTPDGAWLSWSLDNDVTGRAAREWTPDGAAFTGPGGDAPGDAIPYDRAYTYDGAGRLAEVHDRTAAATGIDITDPSTTPCVTRTYGFDRNDNRLSKTVATSGADGLCPANGGTTTTRQFDTGDRPTAGSSGSYTYDSLGRTTKLPASDTPHPAAGDVTVNYYDNDLVKSIAQGGTTATFSLDAADRRTTDTVADSSTTTQTTRHYTDSSDNPTWVTQGSTAQRYLELIGGDLNLTVDQNGAADLTVSNPSGSIVSTINIPAGGPATTLEGWDSFDEYGNPDSTNDVSTGPVQYGWLGNAQRAADESGLILMGVRLYNPVTGIFSSLDPVDGGNGNAYNYPTDPINQSDTDGQLCTCGPGSFFGGGPRGGFGGSGMGGGNKGSVGVIARGGGYISNALTRIVGMGARGGWARWGARQRGPSGVKAPRRVSVSKNSNGYVGRSYGYTIFYRHRSKWHTYKYGITSGPAFARPGYQLAGCSIHMRSRCRVGRRIRTFGTRYQARLWEDGRIRSYWLRHGTCPPGQPSCR